jgi:hypothetical protein
MIDDMASLKQAMEQMDAEDVEVSHAGKDRAAQILNDAKLNFSKLAEMIEERRLLLRPKIVTNIKRMDQPDVLGDAAFRDAGFALRREGQSFGQIAQAIELNGRPAPRNEYPVQKGEPPYQMEMENEPAAPAWLRALNFGARIVFYPLRHPIRFLVIAVVAFMLFNTYRAFVGGGRQISGYVADVSAARQRVDSVMSSISSFFENRFMRSSQEAASPQTSAAPTPSPSPTASSPTATPSTRPATAPTPSATESATAPPPAAAPAGPPASTPRLDARSGAPSKSAANDRARTVRPPPTLENLLPEGSPRSSRIAGPCIGGVGGCYWGGRRY